MPKASVKRLIECDKYKLDRFSSRYRKLSGPLYHIALNSKVHEKKDTR